MKRTIKSDEVNKLIALGKENGFLTYDDINNTLPSEIIFSEQIDDILIFLHENNIKIVDVDKNGKIIDTPDSETGEGPEKAKDEIPPLPMSALGKTGDPVKLYLREMGLESLLSREQEVEIAKMIEKGEKRIMEAIFGLPIFIKKVVDIGDKLRNDEIKVKTVVDNLEDENGFTEEDVYRESVGKLTARVGQLDARNSMLKSELRKTGWMILKKKRYIRNLKGISVRS